MEEFDYVNSASIYKEAILNFLQTITINSHWSNRLNKIFEEDTTKIFNSKDYLAISTIILTDWSGPTYQGWDIQFPTGIYTESNKASYYSDLNKLQIKICGLLYVHSYECFEAYLQNCLQICYSCDAEGQKIIYGYLKFNPINHTKRLSDVRLFGSFERISPENWSNTINSSGISLRELWFLFSNVRHAITHSESLIKKGLVSISKNQFKLFTELFPTRELKPRLFTIEIDSKNLQTILKYLACFAYQIQKMLFFREMKIGIEGKH